MNYVYDFEIKLGADTLFNLEQNKQRRYTLSTPVFVKVYTDCGIFEAYTKPGFIFDGRSGPPFVDFIVPNLGSLGERTAFFLHDCAAYAGSLDFKNTNLLLKYFLRDMCGYSELKSEVIRMAVSLSKSWYGYPKPDDEWYCNVGKVRTSFHAF